MNPYKTKEFKQLQKEWYDRLKQYGFDDAELSNGTLKRPKSKDDEGEKDKKKETVLYKPFLSRKIKIKNIKIDQKKVQEILQLSQSTELTDKDIATMLNLTERKVKVVKNYFKNVSQSALLEILEKINFFDKK